MKLSFSTTGCARLNFATAAAVAARTGFDGVELPALRDMSLPTRTNALLTSTRKINTAFLGVQASIVSIDAGFAGSELSDRIRLAIALGAQIVQFKSDTLFSDNSRKSAAEIAIIRQSAELAARANIALLIENRPRIGSAREIWHVLDRIDHPAVGCCWNISHAERAGESPAVAVPMLNLKIGCVRVSPARASSRSYQNTLERLRGIGYRGGTLVAAEPNAFHTIEEFETALKASIDALRLLSTSVAGVS